MKTMSVNGNFKMLVENGKVEEYLKGLKFPLQAEWGSLWLIKLAEGDKDKDLMSLPWFAKNYNDSARDVIKKREVSIVPDTDLSLHEIVGNMVSENSLFDAYSESALEAVEDNVVRLEVLRDWFRLNDLISIIYGESFIKLTQSVIKDKASSCCGSVRKKYVWNQALGSTFIRSFHNQKECDQWEKDNASVNMVIHTCTCKQKRASRMKKFTTYLTEYKAEGLIQAVLSDPLASQYGVWGIGDLDVDGGEVVYDFEVSKQIGFGGVDYVAGYSRIHDRGEVKIAT